MTDNEIRIAIAKHLRVNCMETMTMEEYARAVQMENEIRFPQYFIPKCPNYPNDLNVVHEVLLTIGESERITYLGNLYGIVDTNGERATPMMFKDDWKIHNANARQRCEALLRTWGLWKE